MSNLNRAVVVLYQGEHITSDVEEAVLQVIAPFVKNNTKVDFIQMTPQDVAKKVIVTPVSPTNPDVKAAELIGIKYEKYLKKDDAINFTLALARDIDNCGLTISDANIATIRALKLAAHEGFTASVGSTILKKYKLTKQILSIIRTVLDIKGIPYE